MVVQRLARRWAWGPVVVAILLGDPTLAGRVPVTTDTLFRWASISKPLTTVASMQLVERGRWCGGKRLRDREIERRRVDISLSLLLSISLSLCLSLSPSLSPSACHGLSRKPCPS